MALASRGGRIAVLVLAGLAVVLIGAYQYRAELFLQLIAYRNNQDPIGNHQPVVWSRGPAWSEPAGERPPNIIVILADDLGINDISTFGGGVAGGRVPTPGIDRLAREGVSFSDAYSGTGTCAPSRAMLLTGRYPTRTGFEFTPTPDGMGRALSLLGDIKDPALPPT